MSVATSFRYHRPFPFCPVEFDPAPTTSDVFVIRDLTLEDAMKLYWSLESIDIAFAISGARFSVAFIGDTDATVSASFSKSLTNEVFTPRERVCEREAIFGEINETDGVTVVPDDDPPFSPVSYDLGFGYYFGYSLSEHVVVRQTNGKYAFGFQLDNRSSQKMLGLSGGGDEDVAGLMNYIDVPVLSGTLRVYGAAYEDFPIWAYYADTGTLDSASVTPHFHTYS